MAASEVVGVVVDVPSVGGCATEALSVVVTFVEEIAGLLGDTAIVGLAATCCPSAALPSSWGVVISSAGVDLCCSSIDLVGKAWAAGIVSCGWSCKGAAGWGIIGVST